MRSWLSRSGEDRLAWRRLESAYAAMQEAEDELDAALRAVVLQDGINDRGGLQAAVVPLRRPCWRRGQRAGA